MKQFKFTRDYELATLMQRIVELTTRRVTGTAEIDGEFEVAMRSLRLKYETAMVDIEQQEASDEENYQRDLRNLEATKLADPAFAKMLDDRTAIISPGPAETHAYTAKQEADWFSKQNASVSTKTYPGNATEESCDRFPWGDPPDAPPVDDVDLLVDEFSMANGHINFLHKVIEDLREEVADNIESREEYEAEALNWHLANINSQSEVTRLKEIIDASDWFAERSNTNSVQFEVERLQSEAVGLNLINDLQVVEIGRLREQLELANDKLIDKMFQKKIIDSEEGDGLAKAWDLFREKVADLSKDNSRKKLDMMYQLEEDLELLSMDYVEEYESIRDQYQPSRNAEGAE